MECVDLAAAREARGLRLIVIRQVPSPWTEAAKGILRVKGVPFTAVAFKPRDAELAAWAGARNAPVALYDDEGPRTGWAEILALAERLDGGRTPLVPADADLRVRMHGLGHEVLGEGGLAWSARLALGHASLASNGARGFPARLTAYLAPKYGYTPEGGEAAGRRIAEIVGLFDRLLAAAGDGDGAAYLLGGGLTALDIYLAVALTPIVGVSPEECPLSPELQPAFAGLPEIAALVPPRLRKHRAMMYERHLGLPIAL